MNTTLAAVFANPSALELLFPLVTGLIVMVIAWTVLRGFFRRLRRHIEQTERHQQRVEQVLDQLLREREG